MPGTPKKIAGLITHYFGGNRTPKFGNSDFETTSKQGLNSLRAFQTLSSYHIAQHSRCRYDSSHPPSSGALDTPIISIPSPLSSLSTTTRVQSSPLLQRIPNIIPVNGRHTFHRIVVFVCVVPRLERNELTQEGDVIREVIVRTEVVQGFDHSDASDCSMTSTREK